MRVEKAWFLADGAEAPEGLPEGGFREVALPHQWSLEGVEAEVGWYRLALPEAGPRRFLLSFGTPPRPAPKGQGASLCKIQQDPPDPPGRNRHPRGP